MSDIFNTDFDQRRRNIKEKVSMPRNRNKNAFGRALMKKQEAHEYKSLQKEVLNSNNAMAMISSMQNPNKSVTEHSNQLDELMERALLSNKTYDSQLAEVIESTDFFARDISETDASDQKKNLFSFKALPIPKRPDWKKAEEIKNKKLSKQEFNNLEQQAFLAWRRHIAKLEEENRDLAITPFEKNLEFWRQLWRVIEKSDLVIQVLDARNPLLFRCLDLEAYVKNVSASKNNFLLINKADFLSEEQRTLWKAFFIEENVSFAFFSAKDEQENFDAGITTQVPNEKIECSSSNLLNRLELLYLLSQKAKECNVEGKETVIGMVGYPNVGKSSCINAILGISKTDHNKNRVSVATTPGHTKHFQTIDISSLLDTPAGENYILCDCPGLVFPTFMSTKADLYLNGILPIDEIRSNDYFKPLKVLCSVIPKTNFEIIYSLKFDHPPSRKYIDPVTFIEQFCKHKKLFGSGRGRYNEPQGAKIVLKDFVKGKVCFCKLPPNAKYVENSQNTPTLENLVQESLQKDAEADLMFEEGKIMTENAKKANKQRKQLSRRNKHKRGKNRINDCNPYENKESIGAYVLDRKDKNNKYRKGVKIELSCK